jgi:hypothetical protein
MIGTTALAGCAAIAATGALAGCGTVHTAEGPSAGVVNASHPAPSSQARTPRQRAEADAESILKAFVAPPGATALRGAPSLPAGTLNGPASRALTPDLVDDVSWWRVPGQPDAVLAWEKTHLPRRFSLFGWGSGYHGAGTMWDEFSLPGVPGVLSQRELQVQAVSDGDGQTVIRVDAQDAWLPAKPASERVPAGVTAVTITAVAGMAASGKPPAPVTVTDPSKVARIVSLVDGLPVVPPGTYGCGAMTGRELRLTFRSGAHGAALAVATANVGGCPDVRLTIDGKPQPGLSEGATLVTGVLGIVGLNWPGY